MKEDIFVKLAKSKFRSSFKLSEKDLDYIANKGLLKIKEHAYDFVRKRLAPKVILNDGKQTPMKGHPVFVSHMQLLVVVEVAYINGIEFL